MTDAEEQQLRELGDDLAGALQSPWQPLCIAEAFGTPREGALALTMQGWIDLERVRSPLLLDQLPETFEELALAAEVFGLSIEEHSAEEAMDLGRAMKRAIAQAFAAALPMQPPATEAAAPREADGFGTWAPLYACLVTQCGLDRASALTMRVDQAYVLVATHRRNEGWQTAGTPYALREVTQQDQEETPDA